jgi:hypothetical protein
MVQIAMSAIEQMRVSGDIQELSQTLIVVRGRLKESFPHGLQCFSSIDFVDCFDWLFSQTAEISCISCDILNILVHGKLDRLIPCLIVSPMIDHLISAVGSDNSPLCCSVIRLFSLISKTENLGFLFPMIASRYSLSTAKSVGRFLTYQMPFLAESPDIFEFIRTFRECPNLDAVASMRWGLQRAIQLKCESVILEMRKPDWLAYFSQLMHGKRLIGGIIQGFAISSLMIPYLEKSEIRELTDFQLIEHHLETPGSMRSHPAILEFLARLIDFVPEEIDVILQAEIQIINWVLRLVEEGRFATRENALKVLVSLVKKGSATQIHSIGAEGLLIVFLQHIGAVSDRDCLDVLISIRKIVEGFAERERFDEVEYVFRENNGQEIMQAIRESDNTNASQAALDLMNTFFGTSE